MRAKLPDVELYFDVNGAGLVPRGDAMVERPTLLLLHGGPGFDHTHFKPAVEALTDVAQLVFVDQRGQGRSGGWNDPARWTLDQWADDVASFCEAIGIRRPILLGSSFGGFVALNAARRHPTLAAGLIIIGSAARVTRERIVRRFGELAGPEAEAAARALMSDPDDPAVVARYIERCFPAYARDGLDPHMAPRSIANSEVTVDFFRPDNEYGRFDYRPALAGLDIPALLLHGERDPIVPVEFARETAASFAPGLAELIVYATAGHDIQRDEWRDASRRIRAFVKRLGDPGHG